MDVDTDPHYNWVYLISDKWNSSVYSTSFLSFTLITFIHLQKLHLDKCNLLLQL